MTFTLLPDGAKFPVGRPAVARDLCMVRGHGQLLAFCLSTLLFAVLSGTSKDRLHAQPSSSSLPAARQGTLTNEVRQELQKLLATFLKARSEEDRAAILPNILCHGKPAVDYLLSLKPKSDAPSQAAIEEIDRLSVLPLGLDLLKEAGPKPSEFSANYFRAGEIVLFRKDERFGGFAVTPASNPVSGSIALKWWAQKSLARKLADAGGQSGEVAASGRPITPSMRPNSGYTDLLFEFSIEALDLKIRFVGPAAYRLKYGGDVAFAFSAEGNQKKILGSDPKITWLTEEPEELSRAKSLLSRYIERTIPGCESLPLTEAEKASFAQYEMVQIDYRQTRPDAAPLFLIRFQELRQTGFQPYHRDYMVNFLREIVDLGPSNVLLMAGVSQSPEANQFLIKNEWARPSKEIVQLLRSNFPEEGRP